MARPLFQLGDFQFDLPNGVPQSLDRTAEFRWEQQDRLLRDPALQFMGPGAQEITLDGVLLPGLSGTQGTMETLRLPPPWRSSPLALASTPLPAARSRPCPSTASHPSRLCPSPPRRPASTSARWQPSRGQS